MPREKNFCGQILCAFLRGRSELPKTTLVEAVEAGRRERGLVEVGAGLGRCPLAIVTCFADGGFGSSQPGSWPGATLSLWNVSRTVSALNFASTPPKAIAFPLSSRYFLLFGKGPVRRSTWDRMATIGGMVRNVRRIVRDGDKNAQVKRGKE